MENKRVYKQFEKKYRKKKKKEEASLAQAVKDMPAMWETWV